jgi:ABC-2 type transport system ATP-binding protein
VGNDTLQLTDIGTRIGAFTLADITFELGMGEVVGYVGHNGSGKSTTFRIIGDLVRPTSGTVRFGELDHRADERRFKREVSIIGENASVYTSMRVSDVLAFARVFYRRWDDAWCRTMQRELRLPLDTKVAHLSTGMRTKLAIVLGLSGRPQIVVMDEPTSGLDPASQEWVWAVVDDQTRQGRMGFLVSSHSREEVVDHCTRVVVLDEGRIRERLDLAAPRSTNLVRLRAAMGGAGESYAD